MASYAVPRHPAILGGIPVFRSSNPVPQIFPSDHGYAGEHSAVVAVLHNEPTPGSVLLSSRQRYVSKGLRGSGPSHRSNLQRRLIELLGLDAGITSVICVTSGTHALRAALKAVLADCERKSRNEVIVPATTVASTAEAVIMEGFVPVLTDVDPHSWMLSPEATEQNITEKTAAIVTVDWLGTHCDLGPFRKLADKHGVKLISDSAQSFGASPGKPFAIDLADAIIYSTGFPKVFHTGGSGGIVICSTSQAEWLEKEPTGILRHEAMLEANAYMGLRALDELPKALEARTKAANTYRQLLRDTPGIAFQHIPSGSGANHYQLSVTVSADAFGLDAKTLCKALQAENMICSTERMRCLGTMSRLLQSCRVAGDLPVSRALGENSITLPIFNHLTPEVCETICFCVKALQEQSAAITLGKSPSAILPLRPSKPADVIDIAAKFREYSVVRITDEKAFASGVDGSVHSTILVPRKYLAEHKISIDEIHRRFLSKSEWGWGDEVIDGLVVHAKNGGTVLLSSRDEGHSQNTNKSVSLDESGSSANVVLVLGRKGEVEVHKMCIEDGIDGNGRPWLERQQRFLASSIAVKETDLFVKPLEFTEVKGTVSIILPYVPSHSLAEMAFAGMGAASLLAVLTDLLGDMASSVWSKGVCDAPTRFIEQAHFDRMKRRVTIARAQVPELDKVADYESITLNGRRLLGFNQVLEALSHHPRVAEIGPRALSEIHGDLNIYNILCRLDPDADRPVVLIDPRGVPLLDESASPGAFEPGDYCYDLSKLKFSLSGFAEIRKGLCSFQGEGRSFKLVYKRHPGSDTMIGADRGFIAALSCDERMRQRIDAVEPSGLQSFELRVLLGEAAHFVADSACALGRDKSEEVLPLFLAGLEKLNDVLELIERKGDSSIDGPKLETETEAMDEGPDYGVATIQSALLKLGSSDAGWAWDVLEVLVKSESTTTAQQLLRELIGEYLPERTDVHVSTHPVTSVRFPCVIIHPFDGVRGQTHAVLSGVRRTSAFLKDTGMSQETIDELRIVTVTSTGASANSQYTSRQNDLLLSPGPWGISPLKLSVLQANQFVFPRAGRWVVENDSFFVLDRALNVGGDGLCLLTSKRRTMDSNSSRGVCIDSTDDVDGRTFASGFRDIGPDEKETDLLKPANAIFLPNHLGHSLVQKEEDYASRSSPLLIDVVLPHFMQRADWIQLSHSRGFGVNSDLAWNNAKQIVDISPKVELAYGGDGMELHSFGSDSAYTKLIDGVAGNPLLNSLAYLPSMAKWLRCRVDSRGSTQVA